MELKDIDDNRLLISYAGLLKEIDNNYKQKKDFEEEMKRRFDNKKG